MSTQIMEYLRQNFNIDSEMLDAMDAPIKERFKEGLFVPQVDTIDAILEDANAWVDYFPDGVPQGIDPAIAFLASGNRLIRFNLDAQDHNPVLIEAQFDNNGDISGYLTHELSGYTNQRTRLVQNEGMVFIPEASFQLARINTELFLDKCDWVADFVMDDGRVIHAVDRPSIESDNYLANLININVTTQTGHMSIPLIFTEGVKPSIKRAHITTAESPSSELEEKLERASRLQCLIWKQIGDDEITPKEVSQYKALFNSFDLAVQNEMLKSQAPDTLNNLLAKFNASSVHFENYPIDNLSRSDFQEIDSEVTHPILYIEYIDSKNRIRSGWITTNSFGDFRNGLDNNLVLDMYGWDIYFNGLSVREKTEFSEMYPEVAQKVADYEEIMEKVRAMTARTRTGGELNYTAYKLFKPAVLKDSLRQSIVPSKVQSLWLGTLS